MIHRQNWTDVRAYLRYIERVRQNDPETVKRARAHLRHLLEWADETLFAKARAIDPTFPSYLLTARSDGKKATLAPASIIKCLANARQFFAFARTEWPHRYKPITTSWMSMLLPPRHMRADSRLPAHLFYSLEDVVKIASVSTATLREERGQVAICMLFLSGMRAEALASVPISCVDLSLGQIKQLPEMGVHTKNHKAAITYLLPIPELLEVVKRWDQRVRALPLDSLWYSTLTRDGMTLTSTLRAYNKRHNIVEGDVRLICRVAGVDYLSPHKLRHGHVVHALKQARNMTELKAISQNVMHASVTITDQVYGRLVGDNVRDVIASLGQNKTDSLDEKLSELIAMLKNDVTV